MKKNFLSISVLIFLFNLGVRTQENLTFACTTEKPIIEREFKRWAEKDVGYIITESEKEAFFKLKSDEDKNTFIENFWLKRDSDPDTDENEFKTEYCERVNETKQFTSGIPGWRTDRGKIYILYGKPDKIERGYSAFKDNTNILYEKWHYDYISGIGGGIELFFIDPTETNEFRVLRKDERKFLEIFTRDMSEDTLKLLQ